MAKKTKNTTATEAALDAAADSAKDAKKLAKTLPKKDAKELRKLADDATKASAASKKAIKRNPGEVVGRAIAAVAGIATAIGRVQKRKNSATTSSGGEATSATPTVSAAAPAASTTDLSSLTVAQLKERAQKAGHTSYSRHTKAQLIDLLSS